MRPQVDRTAEGDKVQAGGWTTGNLQFLETDACNNLSAEA